MGDSRQQTGDVLGQDLVIQEVVVEVELELQLYLKLKFKYLSCWWMVVSNGNNRNI